MKAKYLFLLFLVVLFQTQMSVSAMILTAKRQLALKDVRNPAGERSIPLLPSAFIDGTYLSIELLSDFDFVVIEVINVETGEVLNFPVDLDSPTFMVDLTGMDKGKYVLEVHLNENCFTGDFILE